MTCETVSGFTNDARAPVGLLFSALIRIRIRKRDSHVVYDVRLRDPSGRTYSRTFESKKAAQDFQASERADRARGSWVDPTLGRTRFSKAAERWIEAGIHKRPSSLDRDRSILNRHLLPALGNWPLESITPWDVQRLVMGWAATSSPASVSRQYATLRAIFNYAVTTDMLRRSPCRGINLPAVEPRESPLVTAQDLEYLALHLPGYEPLPYLGGVLGLRWAEAAGLTVRSIDFTKNTVTVEQQWTRGRGGVMVSQRPKSRAGRRTIASPDWLVDMLGRYLADRGISLDDREASVFLGPDGQRLDYSNWRSRLWIPATEAAGLCGLRFHDLRHTAGTALVAAGVDVKTVQIRLGHASPVTTLRIYAQGSSPADRAAADVLGKMFKPTGELRTTMRHVTSAREGPGHGRHGHGPEQ